MKRDYYITVVIICVMTAILYAYTLTRSDCKITLVAPETCVIGELIILDASDSCASTFKWGVIPKSTNFQIIEKGKRAFFSSSQSGTYLFTIAAAKNSKVDAIVHKIQVTGAVNKFTLLVKSWLPESTDPTLLTALGRSFEESIDAEDIESLVKTTAVANRVVLGPFLEQYKPFLLAFSSYLQENYQDKSLEEHTTLWLEMAKILKSC